MSFPSPAPRKRGLVPMVVVLAMAAAAAVVGWAVYFRGGGGTTTTDLAAAAHANARGIGNMNRFDEGGGYERAVTDFEEAVRLAPDWTPAKLNLGIALLNTQSEANLARAVEIFEGVLKTEPDNPYAHYCLGQIHRHQGRIPQAYQHYAEVTRIDPTDPHAWYFRGLTHAERDTSPESREFFQKALDLNPNLNQARYSLLGHLAEGDDAKRKLLSEEHRRLEAAKLAAPADLMYSKAGRYGDVIGRSPVTPPEVGPVPMFSQHPNFQVSLADGTKWVSLADGGGLWKTVRERFGGTLVLLDYDRDEKPDVLLLGAVLRNGQVADLLLHNDGNGRFTDTTAALGLTVAASFGCAAADYNNDGFTDLLVTGPAGVRVFHNDAGKQFRDVSAAAGLGALQGVYLGCAWLDVDQDSDLDGLVARYAGTPEEALARLRGEKSGPCEVQQLINIGESVPVEPGAARKPLTSKFQLGTAQDSFSTPGPAVGVVTSDLDADRDPDLLLLADGVAPQVVLNDRLLRFRRGEPVHSGVAKWNGGLVLYANGDEQPDYLLLAEGTKPIFLLSRSDAIATTLAGRFTPGTTDSPPLAQAQVVDLDLDGRSDVVGLSSDRKVVFLQSDGQGKLTLQPEAFGPVVAQQSNLLSATVCDLDGDGHADLLTWSATSGLSLFRGNGNGNHAVHLELTGKRGAHDEATRTNADGIGATVTALAGPIRASVENTTFSAGLGQSRLPLTLGIGKNETADAVQIRWTDGVPQGELSVRAGQRNRIPETDRRGGSCPVLLTWDGNRFRYVTDFLGGGTVGEMGADGTTRPPRPEESVKIEPTWLVPRDGKYVIKLAEPMDEVMYLDHLRLDVVDHPAGVEVHPDERFPTTGPPPTGELLALRERFSPLNAIDHRARNVTEALHARDGNTVSGFQRRNWIGFAEDHSIELDFGDQLAGLGRDSRVVLVLAGWIEYPYPETIFAAGQAGVPMTTPVLERQAANGKWEQVSDLGFPAGLPKVMTRELPGLAGEKKLKLRVRTNLQIYWDQIYLAQAERRPVATQLTVSRATLAHRGFMQEVSTGRRKPVEYNDDRTEAVAVSKWHGKLTRTGDVTTLLTGHDDRFVICGPADEVTVEFDATRLPPVKAGHVRSFVLRTHGYVKDAAPFTATGGRIGPLPYRAMTSYPDGAADRSKAPADQDRYDREWNTRPAGR